jgi:Zn-dependent protease
VGTLLLPAVAMFFNAPVIGWAKPTPVDPRNFKNPVLDDILTSVVGPISNFVVAIGAVLVLGFVKLVSPVGRDIVSGLLQGFIGSNSDSFLVPLCLLVYELMFINILLGVFNLIPVPPLDGSHVVRHLLPAAALRVYDMVGMFGLFILVFWGGRFLSILISPALLFFESILLRI